MISSRELLQRLQHNIGQPGNGEETLEIYEQRLCFAESYGKIDIEFYGDPSGDLYKELLQTVSAPEIANRLVSLILRGQDKGANGTRNWDLTCLVDSDALFPVLRTVFIEPTLPEHHNQSIIGIEYDEEGQLGRLLSKSPLLKNLTVPSAPDASFFQVGTRSLQTLRVETGYDHQNFIQNLSQSNRFPELTRLDFGDYSQHYIENYQICCTPFDHYIQLFQSHAFNSIRKFILRNTVLSQEQLHQLKLIRPDLSFYLIKTAAGYQK